VPGGRPDGRKQGQHKPFSIESGSPPGYDSELRSDKREIPGYGVSKADSSCAEGETTFESTLVKWAFGLLVLMAAALVIVAGLIFVLVRRTSNPLLQALTPEESDSDARAQRTGEAHAWAGRNGFSFLGYFVERSGGGFIAAWKRADQATFLCQYLIADKGGHRSAFDLVTLFSNDVTLSTGSTADAHLFPKPPGYYLQSFSDLSLDSQWTRHASMEGYLIEKGGARLASANISLVDALSDSIRKQAAYVRSLWFWPLRSLYWFFIRLHLWHNRSIQTLREMGRIRLPNERR